MLPQRPCAIEHMVVIRLSQRPAVELHWGADRAVPNQSGPCRFFQAPAAPTFAPTTANPRTTAVGGSLPNHRKGRTPIVVTANAYCGLGRSRLRAHVLTPIVRQNPNFYASLCRFDAYFANHFRPQCKLALQQFIQIGRSAAYWPYAVADQLRVDIAIFH